MVNYTIINGEQERVGGQWTDVPNCCLCRAIRGTNLGIKCHICRGFVSLYNRSASREMGLIGGRAISLL